MIIIPIYVYVGDSLKARLGCEIEAFCSNAKSLLSDQERRSSVSKLNIFWSHLNWWDIDKQSWTFIYCYF